MAIYDLRSDTVTRPSPAMRTAMAAAPVGDDVYGEDPSVRALEERVAGLLGKEAAVFVPSGTMGNQIGLLLHTRPGDEVVIGEGSHCAWYESGAGAAWAGVQFAIAGRGGLFTVTELLSALKPAGDHYPRTSLVVLENTHNRAGGRVFPQASAEEICGVARARGLSTHLDGARLWNASVATGLSPAVLAAPFDTINVCFSKGLGAPVGSALVGSRDHIVRARRFRKMLGGGMRQAGILAAAAIYALEHNLSRLAQDHENARVFAARVAQSLGVWAAVEAVETNIVLIQTPGFDASELSLRAAAVGVLLNATGPDSLRAVTHLDLTKDDVSRAAALLAELVEQQR